MNTNYDINSKKFPHLREVQSRLTKWLGGVESPEIDEALVEFTGDTYFIMRRLVSTCLEEVERLVETGKYEGYKNGVKLTGEQKHDIKREKEDLKKFLKSNIESAWREILDRQKIGIDKLGIAVRPFIVSPTINDN